MAWAQTVANDSEYEPPPASGVAVAQASTSLTTSNANGLITLEVGQEVSAVAATNASASSSSSLGPTITERRLQSSITVQDGETVALGGLIQDTNSLTKNGLPLLSDIPVIGAVFGSTDHSVQRTELLVLLSPRIVHNAADARAATEELRSRLHSLQSTDTRAP